MFTKFNSRIGRTLVAAILPLGMTLGSTQSTFADEHPVQRWEHHHHDRDNRLWCTQANGVPISFRIDSVSDDTIKGVFIVGAAEYPFGAQFDGQCYRGMVAMGRTCYAFTATVDGNVMHFVCNNSDLVLDLA